MIDCADARSLMNQGFISDNVKTFISVCNYYVKVSDKGYYVNFLGVISAE